MKNYAGFARITLAGTEYPIYFGPMQAKQYCLLRSQQVPGFDFPDYQQEITAIASNNSPFLLADLLYSALVAGCLYEKGTFPMSPDEVLFMTAEMEASDWEAVLKVMTDSVSPNAKAPIVEPSL